MMEPIAFEVARGLRKLRADSGDFVLPALIKIPLD